MATCYETVSREFAATLLGQMVGLRVSRPWCGLARTIWLELGKLRTETHKTKKRTIRTRNGQVALMIEPHWRVENRYSVQLSSDQGQEPEPGFISVSDPTIEKGLLTLKGHTVEAIALTNGLPELELTFDDGRHLRTFGYGGSRLLRQPRWSVSFEDPSFMHLAPIWDGVDVSPWLHVSRGRVEIEYCFDPQGIGIRRQKQFLQQYRFPRSRKQ